MSTDEKLAQIHGLAKAWFNCDDPKLSRHYAEQIAALAEPPEPLVECENCPFYEHLHYEEGGKLINPNCPGFVRKVPQ